MNRLFLVASDMDHTLLMPGCDVSSRNIEAVNRIRDMGGAFVLSTGRSFYMTTKYIRDLDLRCPVIASNGASIYDPLSRREIFSSLIEEETARDLLKLFIKRNTNATLYGPDGIYLMPGSLRGEFLEDYNSSLPPDLQAPLYHLTEDDLGQPLPKFNKFLIIEPRHDELDMVRSYPSLDLVSSAGGFFDVMNKGISKGTGLRFIAGHLGISSDMTFALGDSENDLSMLLSSSHPIAMKGSDPRLLQAAEYITGTCEEDGFAKAVGDFILKTVSEKR